MIPAYQAGAFSVWLVPVMWDRVESHHRLLGFDQALALSQLRALDGTGRGYCPHSCWLVASCASVNTCPAWLGDASRSRTESDVVCSHVPCRPADASSLRGQGSNLRDLVNGQAWLPLHHLGSVVEMSEYRHRGSNPALWDETPASSPADSDGMAESEGVEPSSITSPSLFSRQVAGLPAALSVAEGERIERSRAR